MLSWIVSILSMITSCGKFNNKYEWWASDSAPYYFPMRILGGNFYFPEKGSLYIPTKATIRSGWGTSVSSHVTGSKYKPLPNRFSITFFSYLENKFYHGEFDLPYEDISRYFKEGFYHISSSTHRTYQTIIAGVAPGGYVVVWIEGIGSQKLVFSGYAKETELDWATIYGGTEGDRLGDVKGVLEYELEKELIDYYVENGLPFGLWESYNQKFTWRPILDIKRAPKKADIVEFFNGETYAMSNGGLDPETHYEEHPVPSSLEFLWPYKSGDIMVNRLTFNEKEIFDAFRALLEKQDCLNHIDMLITGEFGVRYEWAKAQLRCGNHFIDLNKTSLEMSGTSLKQSQLKKLW